MKIGFFEESEGVKSMARLQMAFCTLVAAGFTFAEWWDKHTGISENMDTATLLMLWIIAVSPKLLQKFAEAKVK